jgi:hypothetical protein
MNNQNDVNSMKKLTLEQALQKAKELKIQQQEMNRKMRESKKSIVVEFIDGMNEETKKAEIKRAEILLENYKKNIIILKEEFKAKLKTLKADKTLALEILDLVNYQQKNSLPKVKQIQSIENNVLTYKRIGIKDIVLNIENIPYSVWRKTLKEELKKQGINGNDRVADNIIYDFKCIAETQGVDVKK